jgi:hypothetical protein
VAWPGRADPRASCRVTVRKHARGIVLVWQYILTVSEPGKPEDLIEQLLLVVGEEDREDVVTAGEMLIERGRQEAREEGRATLQGILLKLLRARFGALPRSAAARVRAADPAQLERWLGRVVTAPSLADVLAEG